MNGTALIYRDTPIRDRDEMLCLTDMWRAAGGDESKRPAKWLAQEGPQEFVRYIADNLNIPVGDIAIGERGGRDPATWAHWQVGLYYGQYLSPEFRMYCNEVIRRHFEQRHAGGLPAQIELKLIDALERRVDRHEVRLDQHENILMDTHRLAVETHGNVIAVKRWQEQTRLPKPRRFSEEDERSCYLVIHLEFRGLCPIDRTTRLTDDKGRRLSGVSDLDHWHGPQYNRIENAFPVSLAVHRKLTEDPKFREAHMPTFQHFHLMREKLKEQGIFTKSKRPRKWRGKLRYHPDQKTLFDV
jgi:hypothetical protein